MALVDAVVAAFVGHISRDQIIYKVKTGTTDALWACHHKCLQVGQSLHLMKHGCFNKPSSNS